MKKITNPFSFMLIFAMASVMLWSCQKDDPDPTPTTPDPEPFELWVTDQAENTIIVFDGQTNEEKAVIDMGLAGGAKPHMVLFSPDYQFAYIACVGGDGTTVIVRTSDYKVITTLQTGPGSHAAIPTFDGTKVWVAVINEFKLVEISVNAAAEEFTISRELDLAAALPDTDRFPASKPICHMFTPDDDACYVTLGGGGLAVVNVETMEVMKEFPHSMIDNNGCGLVNGPEGSNLMFANSGLPDKGSFYLFDTRDHDLIQSIDITAMSGNLDAHGVAVTNDGTEMWMINRLTDNIMIYDIAAREFKETFEVPDAPDLLVFSPDGTKAFMTLRGDAQTGGSIAHAISGSKPGYAIIDVETRTVDEIIQFGPSDSSDPHGINLIPNR